MFCEINYHLFSDWAENEDSLVAMTIVNPHPAVTQICSCCYVVGMQGEIQRLNASLAVQLCKIFVDRYSDRLKWTTLTFGRCTLKPSALSPTFIEGMFWDDFRSLFTGLCSPYMETLSHCMPSTIRLWSVLITVLWSQNFSLFSIQLTCSYFKQPKHSLTFDFPSRTSMTTLSLSRPSLMLYISLRSTPTSLTASLLPSLPPCLLPCLSPESLVSYVYHYFVHILITTLFTRTSRSIQVSMARKVP